MTTNVITAPAAVAAVVSPWWLPILHSTSEAAALILPIIGVLWLVIQIAVFLYRAGKRD